MRQFPNLKIIPTSKALLHEEPDPKRVARLSSRLAKEKFMMNPVMVSPLKNGTFVVLDGANRVTAFRKLGIPHITAQVLEYNSPSVKLETWNHLVLDPRFKKYVQSDLKRFKLGDGDEMLKFVNLYKPFYYYERVIGEDVKSLKQEFGEIACLIVFPKFQPKDIKRYALNGEKIPAGITRHVIQGRALRLQIPLSILRSSKTTVEKNRWLNNYLKSVKQNGRQRYYAEPVFLFDE